MTVSQSPLPGNPSQAQLIARMIRVNQAGEYGAARIYEGQLAVLKDRPIARDIEHMRDQEQEHLDTFDDLIRRRRIRPTLLSPLWHVGGYLLGQITARLGEKTAMACTVAVEEVIDQHYAEQIEFLETKASEPDLLAILKKFRNDELQHRDLSLDASAADAPAFRVMKTLIQGISKSAIWLSTRI